MDSTASIVAIIDEGGMIGTGTLIDDDTILTSRHILTRGKRYGVRFADTGIEWAQVRATHPTLDIALLSLENPHEGKYPTISTQKLTAGLSVVALGIESESFSLAQRSWTLLALDVSADIGGVTYPGLIRSDIPLQAGYSGGPLLNPEGEIIGVHTAYEPAGASGWSTLVNRDIIRELTQ